MPVDTPAVLARVRERIATLAEKRRTLIRRPADHGRRGEILALDDDLREIIGGLRDRLDPCDASPEVPLVLLPVRIESKLTPGTSTLRVRISPDEAHIDSLLRALSDAEVAAGVAYWSAVWIDAADAVAWPALNAAVGERRAGWVAEATTPINLATRGQGGPTFPALPEEVAHGTVARCLPDQFVVRVFPNGAAPITVTGSPVATDVPLSPIAFGDDALSQVAGLTVPVGSEWTVDFEAAQSAGLGVEVQLPGGTTLIDRIVVVGTRNSVSEEANAADFVDLLTSHRFSDGVSLLAAGTATNNADAERSPYRPAASAGAPPVESRMPSRDASLLAAALGLDAASVEHLIPAGPVSTQDEAQAAANTALWFATWEPVLERLDDLAIPAVTPGSIESARRLHRDHVRGAGTAPALRIGAQPYGVLPVTDLDAWSPRSGETTAQLVPLIRRTLARWVSRSPVVPHVRPGGQLDDQDLLDMLGTSPVATGVRARPAVDGPQLASFAAATGADPAQLLAEAHLRTAVLAQFSVDAAKILSTPAPHDDSRTIGLPLVSERDAEVVAEILAGTTPKVDSVLQALLDIAWDSAKRLRFRATPEEFVGPLLDFVQLDPEIRRVVTMAASADAAVDDTAPERFFAAAERVAAVQHFDGQPTERVSIVAIEPVAEARTHLPGAVGARPRRHRTGEVAGQQRHHRTALRLRRGRRGASRHDRARGGPARRAPHRRRLCTGSCIPPNRRVGDGRGDGAPGHPGGNRPRRNDHRRIRLRRADPPGSGPERSGWLDPRAQQLARRRRRRPRERPPLQHRRPAREAAFRHRPVQSARRRTPARARRSRGRTVDRGPARLPDRTRPRRNLGGAVPTEPAADRARRHRPARQRRGAGGRGSTRRRRRCRRRRRTAAAVPARYAPRGQPAAASPPRPQARQRLRRKLGPRIERGVGPPDRSHARSRGHTRRRLGRPSE
ncbi:hypothetical protein IWX89_001644 [Cryobacterium sp. MP_M3]|nr:hypothetical protein [Cryobacterium sp. MP_M3]